MIGQGMIGQGMIGQGMIGQGMNGQGIGHVRSEIELEQEGVSVKCQPLTFQQFI